MHSKTTRVKRKIHARKNLIRLLMACVLVLASFGFGSGTQPASAYCSTGMGKWGSPSAAKKIVLSTSFPSAMRPGLASALAQWNQPSSVLRYSTPLYTSAAGPYAFMGKYAYSTLMGTAPGLAYGSTTANHNSGTLFLSSKFTWVNASQNITAGKADVQTVSVHEVGHFTGLAHPWVGPCTDGTAYTAAEQASVMTTINTGTRRNLNSDDIAAVQAFY